MVLCHYPLLEWDCINNGVIHINGHCHGTLENTSAPFRYDVGVESISKIFMHLGEIEEVFGVNVG